MISSIALVVTLSASASPTISPTPTPGNPLAGTWILNREKSDDPIRKMRESMPDGPRGRGGMGGPGGGRGGPGGGMGGPGGGMGGSGGGMGGRGGGGPRGGPGGMWPGAGPGAFESDPPLDGASRVQPDAETSQPDEEESSRNRGGGAGRGPGGRFGGRGPRGLVPSPEFTIEQDGTSIALRTEANLRLLRADGEKRTKDSEFARAEVVTKWDKETLEVTTKPERGGKRVERYFINKEGQLNVEFASEGQGRMPSLKFRLVYDRASKTPSK